MILGYASGMPVVAAVATRDRWNTIIMCPYCDYIHRHGGHGPGSPFGAIDDGRYSHCRNYLPSHDGPPLLMDAGIQPHYYVLKEVPGRATLRGKTITYDYPAIAAMKDQIAAFIRDYESRWEGPEKRRPGAGPY